MSRNAFRLWIGQQPGILPICRFSKFSRGLVFGRAIEVVAGAGFDHCRILVQLPAIGSKADVVGANVSKPQLAIGLGTNVSGVVAAVADGVTGFAVGNEAYAMVRLPERAMEGAGA